MPPIKFEPTISAGKQPQTYALDHADSETSLFYITLEKGAIKDFNHDIFFLFKN
jgi:hypothetical protein